MKCEALRVKMRLYADDNVLYMDMFHCQDLPGTLEVQINDLLQLKHGRMVTW